MLLEMRNNYKYFLVCEKYVIIDKIKDFIEIEIVYKCLYCIK